MYSLNVNTKDHSSIKMAIWHITYSIHQKGEDDLK